MKIIWIFNIFLAVECVLNYRQNKQLRQQLLGCEKVSQKAQLLLDQMDAKPFGT